jgi:hypothetical protein
VLTSLSIPAIVGLAKFAADQLGLTVSRDRVSAGGGGLPPGPAQPGDYRETQTGELRKILSQYDLRRITPGELKLLAEQLWRQGLLSEREYHDLLRLKADLEEAGVPLNEPVDLLRFCQHRLMELSQPESKTSDALLSRPEKADASQLRRQQELVQKLAALADWG